MADALFDVESAEGGAKGASGASGAKGASGPGAARPAGRPAAGSGASAASPPGSASIVLRVHVQPAAGRAAVVGRYGDALHVRVAAPPVGGRANEATAELLADLLDLEASQIELAGGERNRAKRFRIRDVDPDEVTRLLDLAVDQAGTRGGGSTRARGRR